MIDAYPQELELMSRTVKSFHEGFQWLHGKRITRRWHSLVLVLAAKSFSSLLVAHEALLNGYPEQAVILVRAVEEDVLTATYVGLHPREARYWTARKYTAKKYWSGSRSKVIPSLDKMRRALGPAQAKKNLENYQALSQFGHPKATGLRFVAVGKGRTTEYRAGPGYDTRVAFVAYYNLLLTALAAVALVAQFVGGKDPDWTTQAEGLRTDMLTWVKAQNATRGV